MKLKQVTFSEALEHMKAGKSARLENKGAAYRIVGDVFQFEDHPDHWVQSESRLTRALLPWYIEVEPMKETFESDVYPNGSIVHLIPPKWSDKRIRVTVEEI